MKNEQRNLRMIFLNKKRSNILSLCILVSVCIVVGIGISMFSKDGSKTQNYNEKPGISEIQSVQDSSGISEIQSVQDGSGISEIQSVQDSSGISEIQSVQDSSGTSKIQSVQGGLEASKNQAISDNLNQNVDLSFSGMTCDTTPTLSVDRLELDKLDTADRILKSEANMKESFQNIKRAIVQVDMGIATGSGVVLDCVDDQIIIASSAHVLEYWEDQISTIYFEQGFQLTGILLAKNMEKDIGIIQVDSTLLSSAERKTIQKVSISKEIARQVKEGDYVFSAGFLEKGLKEDGTIKGSELDYYTASVVDTELSLAEYEQPMLYCYGYAEPGMSGGGTFSEEGYFLGLLTGGSEALETISVPLRDIMRLLEEILG